MTDFYSADTDDLDAFSERSGRDVTAFVSTHESLQSGRASLTALPLPWFVESQTLSRYRDLVEFIGENGRFVSEVSGALKEFGTAGADGIYRAEASLVDAALDRTEAERLDGLEQDLIERGVDPAEAAKIRAEVEAQLASDPSLSFNDAALAGLAAYQGITIEEAEQAGRAFDLYPAEVAAVVDGHFDEIAGQHGESDEITIEDLQAAIEDPSLPQDVRDAAYRLAADQILFTNMDVAKQTDLSDEPLGNGFNWSESDGIIGREDVQQFPDKDYQARILLAWHPLVETADDGYSLGAADSHASKDDVTAFVEDEDIPAYVRLAVFDVYAERHGLSLSEREVLEEELAFDGSTYGGRTMLDVSSGSGQARTVPVAPVRTRPVAPRGGPGGGAGAYAVVLVLAGSFGWQYGREARIAKDGNPRFVRTDPQTGQEVLLDPAELEHLTPAEAKAAAAYFAIHGTLPNELIDEIEPHPYLDVNGQWRMSDTNEPVWIEPPPGQFYDGQGRLRYTESQDLVDEEPEPEPQLATDGAGARDGGGEDDDDDPRESKPQDPDKRADPPSWVRDAGYRPLQSDASPSDAATRILNERYGVGNWTRVGPGSEHSQIKKWLSRSYIWS